jgi:phage-related protein
MQTKIYILSALSEKAVEIVSDYQTDTYRAVYTVKFDECVYVLHAFQKKSKKGIATPQAEIELIKSRLKLAEELHKMWQQEGNTKDK